MRADSKLATQLSGKGLAVTAEYKPLPSVITSPIDKFAANLDDRVVAVNVADNPYGVALSGLAASVALIRVGKEPVLQMVTRDRNRVALQSDLLGAASLGVKNVLCLSGYHQKLTGNASAANVFDIDSIQLIAMVKAMNGGQLLNGTKIDGSFSMNIGAVANPDMKPLELNIMRLEKKINAGAVFIQTQPVFDVGTFQIWLNAVRTAGLLDKVAILAGVLPLTSAAEALMLTENHTDFIIPKTIIEQLVAAGSSEAQKAAGLAIFSDTIKKLLAVNGLRGLHILPGDNPGLTKKLFATLI